MPTVIAMRFSSCPYGIGNAGEQSSEPYLVPVIDQPDLLTSRVLTPSSRVVFEIDLSKPQCFVTFQILFPTSGQCFKGVHGFETQNRQC
jgi:hypothetical protein